MSDEKADRRLSSHDHQIQRRLRRRLWLAVGDVLAKDYEDWDNPPH